MLQFLAALAILHHDDLKNRMISSFSSYSAATTFVFSSTVYKSFFYVYINTVYTEISGSLLTAMGPNLRIDHGAG